MLHPPPGRAAAAAALACGLAFAPALQAHGLDAPGVVALRAGHGKVALRVTAGPSGAPYGFTVYWMTREDFDLGGNLWPTSSNSPRLGWAGYDGVPTLNTGQGGYDSFPLGPGESIEVEIGDVADETGVITNRPYELAYGRTWGVAYAFTAFANGATGVEASGLGPDALATTTDADDCTLTLGYWLTHPEEWPVLSLVVGAVTYSKPQLLAILGNSVKGNGLVSLAHQLIPARLNLENGASSIAIAATIAAADVAIGSRVVPPVGGGFLLPSETSALTQSLDDFNNGLAGPAHCGSTGAARPSWGALKVRYR